MGQKSGRNGAPAPIKPSERLRVEARRRVQPSGVRTEFLACCSPDSQLPFSTDVSSRAVLLRACESRASSLCVLRLAYACVAKFTGVKIIRARMREELCRRFRN